MLLLQLKGIKFAPPFKQRRGRGPALQPLSAGTKAHQHRSPIPAWQSTGWEIGVARGFGYKTPKDVDVNQEPDTQGGHLQP